MKKSIRKLPYFEFLERCLQEDRKQGFTLNRSAARMLETIALAEHNNEPLIVSEAIQQKDIGSPATNHRQIGILEDSGWIERQFSAGDRRRKYLFTTAKSRRYFHKRSKLLLT